MRYGLVDIFKPQGRNNVRKEFIFITTKTETGNSDYLSNLFKHFDKRKIDLKFGIIGNPSTSLVKFLTDGREPDSLVSVDKDDDTVYKLFNLLKPAKQLPGNHRIIKTRCLKRIDALKV